jgi:Dynamin family
VFGPLKAGKSTLTNTLAGEYVSPAGFGKETTRRPSLVVQGAESVIEQYFSTEPDVNYFLSQRRFGQKPKEPAPGESEQPDLTAKVRERFNAVADYVRGIRSQEEFQGRIRITSLPLNAISLEQALTQNLQFEPLLTVVRCKGGPLLTKEVAIVDMPGLDGGRSNWREDPIHEWVIKRAEFFLFVQSSVAALNNDTQAFLKEVVAHSTKPPIWLVQNVFDARHWLPKEQRKKDEAGQRKEGRKRFVDLLGEEPRADFGINAGLAWDAKQQGEQDWLFESSFSEFETGLAEVLHADRAMIQERNSIQNLRQRLEAAREEIHKTEQHVLEVRNQCQQVREKLGRAKAGLQAVNYRNGWESSITGAVSQLAENAASAWVDGLNTKKSHLQERHDRKGTGKKINEDVELTALKLAAEGGEKHFSKSLLLPHYAKDAEQFCKAAENDAVAQCNRLLAELSLPELRASGEPSAEDIPRVSDNAFMADKLKETRWHFWQKEYDGNTLKMHIEGLAKQWRHEIGARKEAWMRELITNHFSAYCEKRRQHLVAQVERALNDFETASRPKNQAADVTEQILGTMKETLAGLELPLANAVASVA